VGAFCAAGGTGMSMGAPLDARFDPGLINGGCLQASASYDGGVPSGVSNALYFPGVLTGGGGKRPKANKPKARTAKPKAKPQPNKAPGRSGSPRPRPRAAPKKATTRKSAKK
jgi:hypothetical protein